MDINKILSDAPAKISEYAENENKCYADMVTWHEEYKRMRAKTYLETKTTKDMTAKDLDYFLDNHSDLNIIKDKELQAEIEYRSWRQKKEKARDYFTMAMELGRNQRAEFYSLNDTIKEKP